MLSLPAQHAPAPLDDYAGNRADLILKTALDVGENTLRFGGEISRVEDTVKRICQALGGVNVQVFSIPSMIQASLELPDGEASSSMRHVYSTENNLFRLQKFNDISRRLCSGALSISDAAAAITEAEHARPYPEFVCYLGGVLTAGGFAVFFGGSWRDGISAGLIALLMLFLDRHRFPYINRMAYTVINAFVAGVCSILLCTVRLGQNVDMVLIGTIMILIPGLAFGNALRDMLGGNLVSGALRMLESLLLAGMIALGYTAALMLLGGLLP